MTTTWLLLFFVPASFLLMGRGGGCDFWARSGHLLLLLILCCCFCLSRRLLPSSSSAIQARQALSSSLLLSSLPPSRGSEEQEMACKRGPHQLLLIHTTKPPLPLLLPLLARRPTPTRAVSVRAAPPRQHQPRPRPPPRNKRVDPPPRGRTRSPVPLDHHDYDDDDYDQDEIEEDEEGRFSGGTRAAAMPKPPAGFVLDDQGRCIAAASKRIVTIIDDTNSRPLECIIRRVFRSSQDHECMLLCPVDMPVQVLKSTNFSGWIAVDDDQIKQIIPSVAYALARVHMHFVESGFCYTARGGFCFPEEAIQEFHDSGDGGDGVPFEGVEICCFNLDGAHYMIYTPVDPLLFVVVKDKDGVLRIAEDDLMDDPAVVGAIDEETEFTALVEEEEALLETVLGER